MKTQVHEKKTAKTAFEREQDIATLSKEITSLEDERSTTEQRVVQTRDTILQIQDAMQARQRQLTNLASQLATQAQSVEAQSHYTKIFSDGTGQEDLATKQASLQTVQASHDQLVKDCARFDETEHVQLQSLQESLATDQIALPALQRKLEALYDVRTRLRSELGEQVYAECEELLIRHEQALAACREATIKAEQELRQIRSAVLQRVSLWGGYKQRLDSEHPFTSDPTIEALETYITHLDTIIKHGSKIDNHRGNTGGYISVLAELRLDDGSWRRIAYGDPADAIRRRSLLNTMLHTYRKSLT